MEARPVLIRPFPSTCQLEKAMSLREAVEDCRREHLENGKMTDSDFCDIAKDYPFHWALIKKSYLASYPAPSEGMKALGRNMREKADEIVRAQCSSVGVAIEETYERVRHGEKYTVIPRSAPHSDIFVSHKNGGNYFNLTALFTFTGGANMVSIGTS